MKLLLELKKKIYLQNDKNNYTTDDVNYAFDLLNLNKSEIPSKQEMCFSTMDKTASINISSLKNIGR